MINLLSLKLIKCSNILPGNGIREMGLRSKANLGVLILGIGTTILVFQAIGKIAEVNDLL